MRCIGLTRGSSAASFETSRYNRSKIIQGNHRKTGNVLFFRFLAAINIENTKNGTTVNKQKLDNFLNKLNRLKLLKIDVEGMEISVIKGASELIKKFRPMIYVENDRQEHSKELIELLWSLDYKMYWHLPKLYNENNFFNDKENIFGNIVSVNMFCIHKDSNIKILDMTEVLDSSFHPMKR